MLPLTECMELRVSASGQPLRVPVTHRFFCLSVHTVDTTRTTWILEQMVKIKHPVLFVGESGTSKTATTQNFLKNLSEETNVSVWISYLLLCDKLPQLR